MIGPWLGVLATLLLGASGMSLRNALLLKFAGGLAVLLMFGAVWVAVKWYETFGEELAIPAAVVALALLAIVYWKTRLTP
jgi:hypothetical protein